MKTSEALGRLYRGYHDCIDIIGGRGHRLPG